MKIVKLFEDATVRFLKKFYFRKNVWHIWFQGLHTFSEDFMEERAQPEQQHREDIF